MPAAAVAIPAVISAGSSVGQMISGNKLAKQAKKEIDNYQRQDLVNPYEGVQVSTLGADRQREDIARSMATNANLAAMGGSRAILGLTPQMMAQQIQQEAQIAANLDEQEKQRQQLIARGNEMVQNMTETREQQDLAGLGQMWNVGRQERTNGINNLVKTGISTANAFASMPSQGGGGSAQGQAQSQPMEESPVAFQTNMAGLTPDAQASYNQFMSMPTSLNTKNSGVISPSWLQYVNYNPIAMMTPTLSNVTPRIF